MAPARCRRRAIAWPMPPVAPVSRTVRPVEVHGHGEYCHGGREAVQAGPAADRPDLAGGEEPGRRGAAELLRRRRPASWSAVAEHPAPAAVAGEHRARPRAPAAEGAPRRSSSASRRSRSAQAASRACRRTTCPGLDVARRRRPCPSSGSAPSSAAHEEVAPLELRLAAVDDDAEQQPARRPARARSPAAPRSRRAAPRAPGGPRARWIMWPSAAVIGHLRPDRARRPARRSGEDLDAVERDAHRAAGHDLVAAEQRRAAVAACGRSQMPPSTGTPGARRRARRARVGREACTGRAGGSTAAAPSRSGSPSPRHAAGRLDGLGVEASALALVERGRPDGHARSRPRPRGRRRGRRRRRSRRAAAARAPRRRPRASPPGDARWRAGREHEREVAAPAVERRPRRAAPPRSRAGPRDLGRSTGRSRCGHPCR